MRVGNMHQLEQTLHAAVLAPAAMQPVESLSVSPLAAFRKVIADIDLDNVEALLTQAFAQPRPETRLTSRSADVRPATRRRV